MAVVVWPDPHGGGPDGGGRFLGDQTAPPAEIVVAVPGASLAASLRAAWAATTAPRVAFVAAGSDVPAGWIEALTALADAHPEAAAVGGRVMDCAGARTSARWFRGRPSTLSGAGRIVDHLRDIPIDAGSRPAGFLSMANVCVRRDVLDATSCAPAGWSERAFSVEIGLVAAAMNRPLVYDPEIVVARSVAPADPVATTADDSRGLGHVLAAHGSLPAVAGFAAIGDRRSPGAVFAPLLLARSGPSRRRFLAALRHKLTGLRDGWPDRSTS